MNYKFTNGRATAAKRQAHRRLTAQGVGVLNASTALTMHAAQAARSGRYAPVVMIDPMVTKRWSQE